MFHICHSSFISVRRVLFAALLEAACCVNVEDIVGETDVDGVVEGQVLEQIRQGSGSDEERCRTACEVLMQRIFEDATLEEVIGCAADGDVQQEQPFDPSNTSVYVYCVGVLNHGPGFCT